MQLIEQRINQVKEAKTDEDKKTLLESILLMLKGKTSLIEKELLCVKERIIRKTKHPLVASRDIGNLKRPYKVTKQKVEIEKKKTAKEIAIENGLKKRAEERRTKEFLLLSGIPDIFLEARLSDFPIKIKNSLKDSLFLCGAVGCGKTHLLVAIVREYINFPRKRKDSLYLSQISMFRKIGNVSQRVYPIFVSVSDLLYQLKNSYSNNNVKEQDILDRIIDCPVLCLDDFGTSKPTEWNIEIIYQIINSRYNNQNKLVTYIASNLSLDKIAENFDERIASRIAGMCKTIKLTGKDRRLSEK